MLFLGWHRRLALRGSPATARGCGELWRALLAATVAAAISAAITAAVSSTVSAAVSSSVAEIVSAAGAVTVAATAFISQYDDGWFSSEDSEGCCQSGTEAVRESCRNQPNRVKHCCKVAR